MGATVSPYQASR